MFRAISALVLTALSSGAFARSEMIVYKKDSSTVIVPVAATDSIAFTSGLIAYYPYNANVLDESGNSNQGLAYGATLAPDRFGDSNSAYYFNGIMAYINHTGQQPSNDFTFSAWIETDGATMNQNIIGAPDSVGKKGFSFYLTPTGNLSFDFGDGVAAWPYARLVSDSTLADSVWHFVAAVRKGTMLKLYRGGRQIASGPVGPNAISNIDFFTVGGLPLNAFHGRIDQVRLYGAALNENQIQALFHESSCKAR